MKGTLNEGKMGKATKRLKNENSEANKCNYTYLCIPFS